MPWLVICFVFLYGDFPYRSRRLFSPLSFILVSQAELLIVCVVTLLVSKARWKQFLEQVSRACLLKMEDTADVGPWLEEIKQKHKNLSLESCWALAAKHAPQIHPLKYGLLCFSFHTFVIKHKCFLSSSTFISMFKLIASEFSLSPVTSYFLPILRFRYFSKVATWQKLDAAGCFGKSGLERTLVFPATEVLLELFLCCKVSQALNLFRAL